MTAREIQKSLMVERYRRNMVMPNYTPRRWFECDVFELTPAGFVREYEIKLSKQDFFADRKKYLVRRTGSYPNMVEETLYKHNLLAKADPVCPSAFWYVCPEGVINVEDLPEWAGLMWAAPHKNYGPPHSVLIKTVRPAPQIHRHKADDQTRGLLERTSYWRMCDLFLHRTIFTPGGAVGGFEA